MGTLFLVATPIGNLEDISARALRTLREVSLIAAEDTRVTRKLLTHYGIRARTISYFEHNKLGRLTEIIGALETGDVALVSDAGTPGLNDPGYELVGASIAAGHVVSSVPGPSAPIAALVASGLPTDSFLYLGYLPRKAVERREELSRIAGLAFTLIFLESPHRLPDSLADMLAILGDRSVAIGRELTKLHEEIWRGQISQARAYFEEPRGEFVVVVDGKHDVVTGAWSVDQVRTALSERLGAGMAPAAAAAALASESGWARREIYRLASTIR